MARPKKETIDYFPHQINHGPTMYILTSRWGNDGYAFWFQLLETLGTRPGMFIDCKNVGDWQYLLAKTRVTEDTANEILNVLADLGGIDTVFWKDDRIIFCQNFVDGVLDAFRRRQEQIPTRDGVIANINSVNDGRNPANRTKTPPKGKGKGKGKESKGKELKPLSIRGTEIDREDAFELLWSEYPVKDGKKKARGHFMATVKKSEDLENISIALSNYKQHLEVTGYTPKNGSTWFNNWEDFVVWAPPQGTVKKESKFIFGELLRSVKDDTDMGNGNSSGRIGLIGTGGSQEQLVT